MDEVTQQNSALVEKNAATAKTLEEQAGVMQERVGFFRCDGAGEARRIRRPRAIRGRRRRGAASLPVEAIGFDELFQAEPIPASRGTNDRLNPAITCTERSHRQWRIRHKDAVPDCSRGCANRAARSHSL